MIADFQLLPLTIVTCFIVCSLLNEFWNVFNVYICSRIIMNNSSTETYHSYENLKTPAASNALEIFVSIVASLRIVEFLYFIQFLKHE